MTSSGQDDTSPPPELQGLNPKDLLQAGLETVPPVTLPPQPVDSDATIPVARPQSTQPAAQVELPLPEELTKLLPGGNYHVESFLGQGGMGAVYKGMQVRLKRPVAIKIMRRDMGKDYDFEARFEREAQAMAKLNHPNIVSVIDFGEAGPDYLYIVMELIDGADLMDVIRGGQMTQEMALSLLPQICDALQFAHDHGIVHRDIKPSNIMLTRDGRVKMCDFGLAKRYDVESSFRTQTGTGMGTPDYAAPEQFDPKANIDHRADIYALGVMIYQMITGQLPRGVWKPPSQRAEVAPQWDDIVSRAMQSDPSDRYQQASEVKTDVTCIPLAAKRDAGTPARKESTAAGRLRSREANARITSESPPTKSRAPLIFGLLVGAVVIALGAFFALRGGKPSGPAVASTTPSATNPTASAKASTTKAAATPAPIAAPALPESGWQKVITDWDKIAKTQGATVLPGEWVRLEKGYIYGPGGKDGALKATFRFTGRGSAGVKFRERNPPGMYHRASVASDGSTATLYRQTMDGNESILATGRIEPPLRVGQDYELAIVGKGDALAVYVNGKAIVQASDNTVNGTSSLVWARDATEVKDIFWHDLKPATLAPKVPVGAPPVASATKDAPFTNTLGMKFVPVPGTQVLFSIWHTRVQDYAAFAKAQEAAGKKVVGSWKTQQKDGVPVGQEPDHPVVHVNWEDAQAFCQWLTEKDTAAGKLPQGAKYRLPTDAEWSTAVGLPPEPGTTPEEKHWKNDVDYPWGKEWPPSKMVGNYADESFHAKFPVKRNAQSNRDDNLWIEGYTDGYATTSPVGSFPANAYGLYDMGGNVWQWCEDWFNKSQTSRVLRGASWAHTGPTGPRSSSRHPREATVRDGVHGFRCVLEPGPSTAAVSPSPSPNVSTPSSAATKDKPFTNSLGMKFVPVPGTQVLFSIWHTRVQDYAEFAKAQEAAGKKVDGAWKIQQKDGVRVGYEPDHPVVGVSWDDVQAFCAWLTEKETAEGKLTKGAKYRLPTDAEWSTAVGLPPEPGATPEEKNGKNNVDFPWGKGFPPKGKVGNYADESFHAKFPVKRNTQTNSDVNLWIVGYTDGYATTSPVGSFPANAYGLYDMGGNAWQWCEDRWNKSQADRVTRGGSWDRNNFLGSSDRRPVQAQARTAINGFRCVLEPAPSTGATAGSASDESPVQMFNGHRYQFFPRGAKQWAEARADAEARGGHLATITSKEEDEWVRRSFASPRTPELPNVWIGGYQETKDGPWRWVTGEPFSFTAWEPGEPSGAKATDTYPFVIQTWAKSGWDDIPHQYTTRVAGYLVEWDDDGTKRAANPTTATKDSPFTNTLGMKFVPVPGTQVLFSIWHTRVQDYAAFAQAQEAAGKTVDGSWKTQQKDSVPVGREPDHPVVSVRWDEAQAFCAWLTEKEIATGKLPKGAKYRLPTDAEWSAAVGLPTEQGAMPEEKDGKNDVDFPWGKEWPPTSKVGNFADESFHATFPPKKNERNGKMENEQWMKGYTDGYTTTSPVAAFPANAYGLYDMGGNAWQWCEDWWNAEHQDRVLRGASWLNFDRNHLQSSFRGHSPFGSRFSNNGFRCVLEPEHSSGAAATGATAPPSSAAEQWVNLLTQPERLNLAKSVEWTADGLRFTEGGSALVQKAGGDGGLRIRTNRGGMRPFLRARVSERGYYALSIRDEKTVNLSRFDAQGRSTTLRDFTLSAPIPPEQDYTLELRATGSTLTAVLNGTTLGSVSDATHPTGGFVLGFPSAGPPIVIRSLELLASQPAVAPSPSAASKEKPFVNSLGMKFVPKSPGSQVLFSIWETRRSDYEAFTRVKKVNEYWKNPAKDGVAISGSELHPVVGVSWEEAKAFCDWLNEKEVAEGSLPPGIRYRLPTDDEWSSAVRLGKEQGATPEERHENALRQQGSGTPPKLPPDKTINIADETFHAQFPLAGDQNRWLAGYTDGYATTAPVGSFAPNEAGIYDLIGNAGEWCEDLYSASEPLHRVMRGGKWDSPNVLEIAAQRARWEQNKRSPMFGFRVVLAPSGGGQAASTPPSAAAEQWVNLLTQPEKLALQKTVVVAADGLNFTGPGSAYAKDSGPDGGIRIRASFSAGRPELRARQTGSGNYTLSFSTPDTLSLALYNAQQQSGTPLRQFKLGAPLTIGEDYTLELRASGTMLTVVLNGTILGSVSDGTHAKGDFNLVGNMGHAIKTYEMLVPSRSVSVSPNLPVPASNASRSDAGGSKSSDSKFPPGQWVKLFTKPEDLPADLRKPDSGVTWEDGWINLGSNSRLLRLPDSLVGNYAIRARFKRGEGESNAIVLRYSGEAGGQYYQVRLATDAIIGQKRVTSGTYKSVMPPARVSPPDLGQEYVLEVGVVGRSLIGRMDEKKYFIGTDTEHLQGSAHIRCNEWVRDIEVINLDGLPEAEALRLLGVDEQGNDLRGKTEAAAPPADAK